MLGIYYLFSPYDSVPQQNIIQRYREIYVGAGAKPYKLSGGKAKRCMTCRGYVAGMRGGARLHRGLFPLQ